MTTDTLCFYYQNRLIQTSTTGGKEVNGTVILPPLVFHALIIASKVGAHPCLDSQILEKAEKQPSLFCAAVGDEKSFVGSAPSPPTPP
jgi:hypothetical protein